MPYGDQLSPLPPKNLAAYIEKNKGLSLHKVNCKVDLLYPTLEQFSDKDCMEILWFLRNMDEVFDGKNLSEGLASRILGFFFATSTQKA